MAACSGWFPLSRRLGCRRCFCAGILLLQGCSLLPKSEAGGDGQPAASPVAGSDDAARRSAMRSRVEVQAPDTVRDYLERHLEIQRYRQLDDLGAAELSRLMVAAEANARELLGTLGYFTPTLTLELHETPDGQGAARGDDHGRARRTHARQPTCRSTSAGRSQSDARRRGAARRDPHRLAAARRASPSRSRPGTTPRPPRLRSLTAKRYPTGSIAHEPRRDRRRPQRGAS